MSPKPERVARWAEILDLTVQMRAQTEAAEWEAVAELESRRRELLDAFFAEPVSTEEAAMVGEGIQAILAADRQVIAAGTAERQAVAGKLQELAQGRRASNAYGSDL